ncbi:hypothetical protein BC826DRAFT_1090322 [Russula brevipes]|nr:hypothetical protein BC826DRAFT_1090322 [Russula brevipes]
MFTLHPNRSLLNPKFDGYRLDPISSEDSVTRHVLEHMAVQASVSGRHHFSFQEAESRIRHNHLTVSLDGAQAVYIDMDLRVILVRLDHPFFRAIYDIPRPSQTPASDLSSQREYPSSVFADAQTLICADGDGTLHVLTLSLSPIDPARLLGVYQLPSTPNILSSSSLPIPFRLHAARRSADGQAVVVLSFKRINEAPPGASSARKTPTVEFDVVGVRRDFPLDVLWHRRGTNVPLYTAYDERGSPYRPIGQPAPDRPEASPEDEFAPILRADGSSPPKQQQPPPYAWTQDSEEITLAFPLPSRTSTNDIGVLFSPQTLTVRVQDCDAPRYAAARLWGGIAPPSSFWIWDAHADGGSGSDSKGSARTHGLLTLHLEKQHPGTRWPHVFDDAGAGAGTASTPEVPETLDPSELHAIRESLEKYTAALQEGGAGAVRASNSLADGEMDEEVDAAVGTETCVTWVGAAADGADPAWTREDWDVPFTALSTPLPGIGSGISMVVKHAIDGPLFVLSDEDAAGGRPAWTHLSTFSALAFVLASKRDTRFTYHVPSKAVLAFEGGGAEYGGNLYIYRGAQPKSDSAKQAILKITGSTSGSLLGVGAIQNSENIAILCLCEKELLVLRNVL